MTVADAALLLQIITQAGEVARVFARFSQRRLDSALRIALFSAARQSPPGDAQQLQIAYQVILKFISGETKPEFCTRRGRATDQENGPAGPAAPSQADMDEVERRERREAAKKARREELAAEEAARREAKAAADAARKAARASREEEQRRKQVAAEEKTVDDAHRQTAIAALSPEVLNEAVQTLELNAHLELTAKICERARRVMVGKCHPDRAAAPERAAAEELTKRMNGAGDCFKYYFETAREESVGRDAAGRWLWWADGN
jgi:flagellar biosynthesis GTPase FlhF